MALFGSKDKNLPLLTKVQQIQLRDKGGEKDYSELVTFLFQWAKDALRFEQHISTSLDVIDPLWEACNVSQSILQSLATHNLDGEPAYKTADAHRMFDLLQALPNFKPTLFVPGGGEDEFNKQLSLWNDPNGYIHAFRTIYIDWNKQIISRMLERDILRDLGETINRYGDRYQGIELAWRPVLKICEECKNVFVFDPRHPDQSYCSARCSDRVYARKRRSELKKII